MFDVLKNDAGSVIVNDGGGVNVKLVIGGGAEMANVKYRMPVIGTDSFCTLRDPCGARAMLWSATPIGLAFDIVALAVPAVACAGSAIDAVTPAEAEESGTVALAPAATAALAVVVKDGSVPTAGAALLGVGVATGW